MPSIGAMLVFAFGVTFALIPVLIDVSKIKRLFDEPLEYRKIHFTKIPNLAGIAMFTSLLLGVVLLIKPGQLPYGNYFVGASFIIAIVGVKDDLVGIDPAKKFYAQIAAAFIIAYLGDVRITSFHGLFGIQQIAMPYSIAATGLIIVFICNSLNLLDGIDGLAGAIGLVASATYAFCFYKMGSMGECLIAAGMAGAISAFLYYNITPAKIFMGDCGSLVIGFVLAVISIRFVELNKVSPTNPLPVFGAGPAIAIAILILPFYDALRVFFLRILLRRSPFRADSNHLHHRLVMHLKVTHLRSTSILAVVNVLFIIFAFCFQRLGSTQLIIYIFLSAIILNWVLWNIRKKTKQNLGEDKVVVMMSQIKGEHEPVEMLESLS